MLYGTTENDPPKTGDDGVLQDAMEGFVACKEWQGTEDERSRDDTKFANGDARNSWQWPKGIYDDRTTGGNDLPCLTINNTRVHNDLIINQICKNNYGPKIRPVGGEASYKSAEIMESMIRRIQYISKWSAQRRKVTEQQVDGGIGYILIETAYVSERSFDQDIYLKASRDPTGVYLDPWAREPDGSDANFGFIFERMVREVFNKKYKKYKDKVGKSPLNTIFADWISDKEIMVAKYYRKKAKNDTLVGYKAEDGTEVEKLASEIREESGKEIYDALMLDIENGKLDGRTRSVENNEVEWFMIAGDTIVDRGKWAGKYIPICRCVGRELVVDNTLDRKGMTRSLIDPNRMLNYNASMSVEIVALQPKSPFMAPARAIEGQEQYKTMNINGFPVILYNDIDDEAPAGLQEIKPPFRIDPPKTSEAHVHGMEAAERWGMMCSGQFQAQMGENDTQSAASGKAINERQAQGDTATYHFAEHQSDMMRYIGVQLLDLIPKIYDTERTLHVLNEKNDKYWILVDPNQEKAIQELEHEKEDEEAIRIAFSPSVGEYECVSDPGPDYATQRQEAWNALSMVMQSNKEIAASCADLLFKYGDFPGADELMERLQKEIKATKPYLFDDKLEPQMMALQEQNKKLVALNGEMMQKLAEAHLRDKGREEKRDIEAFKAETDRMKAQIDALAKIALTPQQKAQMEHELTARGHEHIYSMIQQANEANVQGDKTDDSAEPEAAPDFSHIGAKKAPDGHWYVPDHRPERQGKYLKVLH